jgi:hypothetical protein
MNNNRPPLFVNQHSNNYDQQYAHQLYQHYNYQRQQQQQQQQYNMYLNNFNIENIQKKSTYITCKNLELNYGNIQ